MGLRKLITSAQGHANGHAFLDEGELGSQGTGFINLVEKKRRQNKRPNVTRTSELNAPVKVEARQVKVISFIVPADPKSLGGWKTHG